MKAMLQRAGDRHLEPSSAIRYVRIKPKLSDLLSVDGALDLASSSGRFDHAGRMTIPSGTTLSAAPLRRAPDRNDDDREDCDDLTDNMASRES